MNDACVMPTTTCPGLSAAPRRGAVTVRRPDDMPQLRSYQQRALTPLADLATQMTRDGRIDDAYAHVFPDRRYAEPEGIDRLTARTRPVLDITACTGAGKTALCAAVPGIVAAFGPWAADCVLWLAPTEVILTQTLARLRDARSTEGQLLRAAYPQGVEVLTLADALGGAVGRALRAGVAVVLVGTVQSLRRTDTDPLRIHQPNSEIAALLDALLPGGRDTVAHDLLVRDGSGRIIGSLANLIRHLEPLVIVDESHHAATALSNEVLWDLTPRMIMRASATPRADAAYNPVVTITGADCVAAGAVRGRIRIDGLSGDARIAIAQALDAQRELAAHAAQAGLPAPHALYTAGSADGRRGMPANAVRDELLRQGVHPEHIVECTGRRNDLRGIDLDDPTTPALHIITVRKATEGLDTHRLGVIVLLARTKSARNVVQTIGRGLRPYARGAANTPAALDAVWVITPQQVAHEVTREVEESLRGHGYDPGAMVTHAREGTPATPLIPAGANGVRAHARGLARVPLLGLRAAPGAAMHLLTSPAQLTSYATESITLDPTAIALALEDPTRIEITLATGVRTTQALARTGRAHNSLEEVVREVIAALPRSARAEIVAAELRGEVTRCVAHLRRTVSLRRLVDHAGRLAAIIARMIEEQIIRRRSSGLAAARRAGQLVAYDAPGEPVCAARGESAACFSRHIHDWTAPMNRAERDLAAYLDAHSQVQAWYRNLDQDGPLFLVDGAGAFFPDFVVWSSDGRVILAEVKGDHLISADDAARKCALGELWVDVAGAERVGFAMVGEHREDWAALDALLIAC